MSVEDRQLGSQAAAQDPTDGSYSRIHDLLHSSCRASPPDRTRGPLAPLILRWPPRLYIRATSQPPGAGPDVVCRTKSHRSGSGRRGPWLTRRQRRAVASTTMRPLDRRRELRYRGTERLPGPDFHRHAVLPLRLGCVITEPRCHGARASGRTLRDSGLTTALIQFTGEARDVPATGQDPDAHVRSCGRRPAPRPRW
jgi:hypothetical protein